MEKKGSGVNDVYIEYAFLLVLILGIFVTITTTRTMLLIIMFLFGIMITRAWLKLQERPRVGIIVITIAFLLVAMIAAGFFPVLLSFAGGSALGHFLFTSKRIKLL